MQLLQRLLEGASVARSCSNACWRGQVWHAAPTALVSDQACRGGVLSAVLQCWFLVLPCRVGVRGFRVLFLSGADLFPGPPCKHPWLRGTDARGPQTVPRVMHGMQWRPPQA